RLKAKINGRLRITQIPKEVDPRTNGILVTQFQNLTQKPIHLRSVTSTNPSFRLDPDSPDTIEPGQVGTIKVIYVGDGSGATLDVTFGEELLNRKTIVVPIQLVPNKAEPETYTREQLDAIQATQKKPTPIP